MNQPLVEYTTDGIPALPETPEAPPVAQPPQNFAGPRAQPASGIPEFENVPKRQADGSFRLVEYVTIKTPGDNKAAPRHKVTDGIRRMYRDYYEAWRKGLEMSPQGTPLEAWPVMDRALVTACKALNIFTVEQLRDTADANIHRLPMGRTLKNRAEEWLKTKAQADAVDALARDKDEMRSGMEMLENQNTELRAQLDQANTLTQSLAARLDALEAAKPAEDPEQDVGDALDAKIDELADKPTKAAGRRGGKKE